MRDKTMLGAGRAEGNGIRKSCLQARFREELVPNKPRIDPISVLVTRSGYEGRRYGLQHVLREEKGVWPARDYSEPGL